LKIFRIITFSNIGGSVKGIRLKDYKDSETGEGLQLVEILDPREYLLAVSSTGAADLDTSVYTMEKADGVIMYSLKTKDLEVTKK
jgi:hypothetical protein